AKLREFWARHPQAEEPLNAWHRTVEHVDWSSPLEVRNTYRSADPIGEEFVVFDICNNVYRLVVRVVCHRSIVYIWVVYTHLEYERVELNALDEKIRREKKQRQAKRSR